MKDWQAVIRASSHYGGQEDARTFERETDATDALRDRAVHMRKLKYHVAAMGNHAYRVTDDQGRLVERLYLRRCRPAAFEPTVKQIIGQAERDADDLRDLEDRAFDHIKELRHAQYRDTGDHRERLAAAAAQAHTIAASLSRVLPPRLRRSMVRRATTVQRLAQEARRAGCAADESSVCVCAADTDDVPPPPVRRPAIRFHPDHDPDRPAADTTSNHLGEDSPANERTEPMIDKMKKTRLRMRDLLKGKAKPSKIDNARNALKVTAAVCGTLAGTDDEPSRLFKTLADLPNASQGGLELVQDMLLFVDDLATQLQAALDDPVSAIAGVGGIVFQYLPEWRADAEAIKGEG